jgi:hypothetical protein
MLLIGALLAPSVARARPAFRARVSALVCAAKLSRLSLPAAVKEQAQQVIASLAENKAKLMKLEMSLKLGAKAQVNLGTFNNQALMATLFFTKKGELVLQRVDSELSDNAALTGAD